MLQNPALPSKPAVNHLPVYWDPTGYKIDSVPVFPSLYFHLYLYLFQVGILQKKESGRTHAEPLAEE